jgi:acetyl esterase/lipase
VSAEWISAANASPERIILYIPGGGFILGPHQVHRTFLARLSQAAAARTLLIDYRLAPEHTFPAPLEDCLTAYQWLLEEGVSPEQLIIAGESAGGNLTLTTMLTLRDAGKQLPAAAACLSAITDFTGQGESNRVNAAKDRLLPPDWLEMSRSYWGERDPQTPLLSPLYANLHGLPPILLQVGGDEMLLSDSVRFSQRAQAADVDIELSIWPGMWHSWPLLGSYLPEAQQAIVEIAAFVQQKLY